MMVMCEDDHIEKGGEKEPAKRRDPETKKNECSKTQRRCRLYIPEYILPHLIWSSQFSLPPPPPVRSCRDPPDDRSTHPIVTALLKPAILSLSTAFLLNIVCIYTYLPSLFCAICGGVRGSG